MDKKGANLGKWIMASSSSTENSKTSEERDPRMDVPQSMQQSQSHDFNEQTNYVPTKTIVTIFLACASVDLLALMDQTTLAASLTIVSTALNARSEGAWIAGAYFVTSTSSQLLYGRLSDIWSRKVILFTGLVIFSLGSLGASLAQTVLQLIVFRALTGVGGGGLMTVAQMIVSDVVPLRERGKYQGILGAVVAISNGIGPVIGGVLASRSSGSWRWIFRLNLFLAPATAALVFFLMPLKHVEGYWRLKVRAIDFVGAFLALGGSTLLVLALTWAGGAHSWNSLHVVVTLLAGILVSICFVIWQWKGTSKPLVPLRIFQAKLVNGACLTVFVNGWNFLVQVYYVPTFYQLAYGYSAVQAGALLLPITLTQTFSSTFSGLVVHWIGRYRESILLGWVAWAVGLGLFSTLDQHSGLDKQIGYGILTGFGVGQTLQPALIAVQAGVERKDMAIVTSFRNFARNLGGTLGLAISGTIINNVFRGHLESFGLSDTEIRSLLDQPEQVLNSFPADQSERVRAALIPAYQKGFRTIFVVGACLAAFAFWLTAFLMPQMELGRPDDEKLKQKARGVDEEKYAIVPDNETKKEEQCYHR